MSKLDHLYNEALVQLDKLADAHGLERSRIQIELAQTLLGIKEQTDLLEQTLSEMEART